MAGKNFIKNALVVVQGHDHPLLSSTGLQTAPLHWLVAAPGAGFRCSVKVRYRQADQAARVELGDDGRARIYFDEPQRAVTPGQYAVLYDGDLCMGGAVIETVASARPAHYNSGRFSIAEAL